MLTFLKQIFIWWNQQTLATRIQTIFFGKFVGVDNFGNKYYESKAGKRWVIYKDEIDASKIPNEWYSWIHFIKNRIEKSNNIITQGFTDNYIKVHIEENISIQNTIVSVLLKKNNGSYMEGEII